MYTKKGRILLVGLNLNYFPKSFFGVMIGAASKGAGCEIHAASALPGSDQAGSRRQRVFSSADGGADELSVLSPKRSRGKQLRNIWCHLGPSC